MRTAILRAGLIAFGFLCTAPAWACNVPVFRFALERWDAGIYEMDLYYSGSRSAADKALADYLVELVEIKPRAMNLEFGQENLADAIEGRAEGVQKKLGKVPLPHVIAKYPSVARIGGNAWAGPFNEKNIKAFLDSPARQEIARRILSGETAVWIFLDSGDPAQRDSDDRAAALLNSELKRQEKVLKLPELTDDPEDLIKAKGLELKIAFSALRLKRDDPNEQMLIQMLLHLEKHFNDDPSDPAGEKRDRRQPMTFAIFGRGRVLEEGTFIGKGITAENIAERCAFLVAPCTCKVKEEIRGVDLPIMVAWESRIEGKAVKDQELPPLTSLTPTSPPIENPEIICPEDNYAEQSPGLSDRAEHRSCQLLGNIGIALGGGLALVVALALLLWKRA